MYLFGGKFCMFNDGLRECTCEEIVYKHPLCRCDRKHFNNILWATVTVFQVSQKSHKLAIVSKKTFEKIPIPCGKMTIVIVSDPSNLKKKKRRKK